MVAQRDSLFTALQGLVEVVGQQKTAAGNPPDPGSIGGATSHPVADLDNGCSKTTTGARAAEYESDIKKDQGAPGVDSVSEISVGSAQDDVQLNIGTTQSATGEDPSTEDAYKGGKDDPGSELPARTDNDSLDGKKYANFTLTETCKVASATANLLLADIVNGYFTTTKAAEEGSTGASGTATEDSAATTDAAPTGEKMPEKPDTETTTGEGVFTEPGSKSASEYEVLLKQATAAIAKNQTVDATHGMTPEMAAGYKLASHLGLTVKQAQVQVAETMEATINDAVINASLVGDYLGTLKRAMEESSGEDHDDSGDDSSGANSTDGAGAVPSGGGDGGEGGEGGESHPEPDGDEAGGDPLAALLGGGGGDALANAGAPAPPEAGGGPPAGGPPAGGPPEGGGSLGDILGGGADPGGMMPPPPAGGDAGGMGGAPEMGGMPGGAPGGAPGGEMDKESLIAELVAAMQELGISPEELAQAGPPPAAPGEMGEGMKLASAAKAFMRSGKYQVKEAREKTSARKMRDTLKRHLLELCAR